MFVDLKKGKSNGQTTYKLWPNKEFLVFTQVEGLSEMQLQKEFDILGVHYFECTFELAKNPALQLNALAVC